MLIRAARLARISQIFPNKNYSLWWVFADGVFFANRMVPDSLDHPKNRGSVFHTGLAAHYWEIGLRTRWIPRIKSSLASGCRCSWREGGGGEGRAWSVNVVHGGDLASFSPGTVGDELRLTPHQAKKLIGAREAFLAGQVGDGRSGR